VEDDGVHPEDRQVQRRSAVHARAGGGHLLEDDGGLVDPHSPAAVLLGDGDAHPAAVGHGLVEVMGEAVLVVTLRPVLVGEGGADLADAFTDQFVIFVEREIHASEFSTPPG
jgi:hypothetical protein